MSAELAALSLRLVAVRQAREVSYRQAAKEIGISLAGLHKVEHGGNPRLSTVLRVLTWLDAQPVALEPCAEFGSHPRGGHEAAAHATREQHGADNEVRLEFGVLCDRRTKGHGRALLLTSPNLDGLMENAQGFCFWPGTHPHLLVSRTVVVTEWSSPLAGEDVLTRSESGK